MVEFLLGVDDLNVLIATSAINWPMRKTFIPERVK
jgi:hypothetical protein